MIDVLRRFWWVVVIFGVVGGVVGGLPEPQQATDAITRWTASHTILVSSSSDDGFGFTDPQAFNQLTLFTTTGQVPIRAAEAIGYDGEPAGLAAQILVAADQQTGALRISTTQDTADASVSVADAFADELVSYLAERQDTLRQDRLASNLTRLTELEGQIEDAEGRERRAPDDRVIIAELDALSRQYSVIFEQYNTLQADQSQLVLTTLERAQPIAITDQGLSAPRSRRTRGILAGAVGASLGLAVASLMSRTDRKLRTREQVEQIIGLPSHAVIPLVNSKDVDGLAVTSDRHDQLADSYRRLRSIVTFVDSQSDEERGRASTTLVVSAGPSDGKSSVSANLIAAFAETGVNTVGVNTDFRRPTLLRKLDVPRTDIVGLTLGELQTAPLNLITTPTETGNLVMVDLSTVKGHSPGQLARATAALIPRLAKASGAVVVDTSPIGATAEVLEFIPLVDNVVMVVRLNHTSIRTAQRTIETVRSLTTGNLLLVVVGGSSTDSNDYYYQYDEGRKRSGRFRRKKKAESTTVESSVGS